MNASFRPAFPDGPGPVPVDRYCLHGYTFGVRTRSVIAGQVIRRLYAAAGSGAHEPAALFTVTRRCAGHGRMWQAVDGEGWSAEGWSLRAVLQTLEYEISRRVIAYQRHAIALHGATVIGTNGGVFITGRSGAGKTTLALALAAGGYHVPGDDIALLDMDTGRVAPLPRMPHVDADSRRLLRRHGVRWPRGIGRSGPVAAVSSGRWSLSTEIRSLVVLSGVPAPQGMALVPVPRSAMAVELLGEAGFGDRPVREALDAVAGLVRRIECYRLARAPLREMVAALAAILGPAPAVPEPVARDGRARAPQPRPERRMVQAR